MERLVVVFFWLSFMFYAASFILYLYLFLTKREITGSLASACVGLAFAFLTFSFLARWYGAGFVSFEGSFEIFALFAWFVTLVYLAAELLTELKILGLAVMPLCVFLLGLAWSKYGAPTKGALGLWWIGIHVAIIFLAYGGFAVSAALSAFYLVQEWQLKGKKMGIFVRRLPSLEVLDNLAARAVEVAQPFMTMGVVTGIIRAQKEVGNFWTDPLVVVTIFVWAVYGIYLLARWKFGWRGRRAAFLSLAGFMLILLIRFVMVNYSTIFHQFGI